MLCSWQKEKDPYDEQTYTHTCFVRSFGTFVLHFEFETVSLSLSVFVCLSVLSLFLSLPPNIRSPALFSLSLSLSLSIYIYISRFPWFSGLGFLRWTVPSFNSLQDPPRKNPSLVPLTAYPCRVSSFTKRALFDNSLSWNS